jgi:hypothetical protein
LVTQIEKLVSPTQVSVSLSNLNYTSAKHEEAENLVWFEQTGQLADTESLYFLGNGHSSSQPGKGASGGRHSPKAKPQGAILNKASRSCLWS